MPVPADAPPVTVIRPVCGIEAFSRETLGSSFALDYPHYEVLFCVAREDDPVNAIVHRLIDAHPEIPARLLVGDDRVSLNPKLNNTVKGWNASTNEWTIMADSNVLMPRDYIQRLLARRRKNTGVVCSVPIGSRPANFGGELECAFLNTFQARWEYAAESLGIGFAQGKSMLLRRSVVEKGGGIRALGAEIAEDAALTKLLRPKVSSSSVDNPFEEPLGPRTPAEVWARQTRWSRLRRMTFPLYFAPEIATTSLLTLAAAAIGGDELGVGAPAAVLLAAAIWYGAEAGLAAAAGWPLAWSSLPAWIGRDLALPALWLSGWMNARFVWRGNVMSADEETLAAEGPSGGTAG